MEQPEWLNFLIEAKKATYAGGGVESHSSRPLSKDLPYRQGDYYYLDTYLGGFSFIGEEAVWRLETPVWGMNYYGYMLVKTMPNGFSNFLKDALRRVPREAPFRGPAKYEDGRFTYACEWQGTLEIFEGHEEIKMDRQPIYRLVFHGGLIV